MQNFWLKNQIYLNFYCKKGLLFERSYNKMFFMFIAFEGFYSLEFRLR